MISRKWVESEEWRVQSSPLGGRGWASLREAPTTLWGLGSSFDWQDVVLEEGSLSEPLAAFQANGLEPHIRLRVHDDYSILSMIEAGLGVSILPELVLRKTNYQVAILPIKPMVIRKIGLIAKEKNALPLASKYFIDFLFEHINDLP